MNVMHYKELVNWPLNNLDGPQKSAWVTVALKHFKCDKIFVRT